MTRSLLLAAALLAGVAPSVQAGPLRWARAGDSLTLDPHAKNEGPTHTLAHQIYEPLLIRDASGGLEPALATDWAPSPQDPGVWVFNLRQGVTFQDGAAFDSADVVFSLNRARSGRSDMKELLASVTGLRATGPYQVEIVTEGPNPILPGNLTNIFIMDEDWARANDAVEVQNISAGEVSFAATHANGTGPYSLVSRDPDVKTVLTQNPGYWGRGTFALQVTDIVFTPIQNPATRVAALLTGEVDFIQDVPVQDLNRVAAEPGLELRSAPQNRVIFFGLNMGAPDLQSDDVEGVNPLADARVRQAMNIALNRDAIRQVVMRGQSRPTGVIAPPFVNGWTAELDRVPATDVTRAKALMARAGFEDGFAIRLDCPNDRYVNDEAICQAAVGMLAQIGISVALDAKPKAQHFPLIANGTTDFYLLGWGVPTYDSEYIFNFLIHSRDDMRGSWNATGYSNPDLDAKIEALASETDMDARNAAIAEIWQVVQAETLYLPIHDQVLNWGATAKLGLAANPEDLPRFKYATLN